MAEIGCVASTIGFDYSIHKIYHIYYICLYSHTMTYACCLVEKCWPCIFDNSKSHAMLYLHTFRNMVAVYVWNIYPNERARPLTSKNSLCWFINQIYFKAIPSNTQHAAFKLVIIYAFPLNEFFGIGFISRYFFHLKFFF